MNQQTEHYFFSSISKFSRIYSKALVRRLSMHGVKPGYLDVFFRLWEQDNISQKELHAQLDIEQATLSNTLKRMERDGFIVIVKNSGDRRHTLIQLTNSGRTQQKVILTALDDIQTVVNAGLTINDRKYFRRVLKQMTDQLVADSEDACLILVDEISE